MPPQTTNPAIVMLEGDSQDIFFAIQAEADACQQDIREAEQEEQISAKESERLDKIVQEEIKDAEKRRFILAAADNKIKLAWQSHPRLKFVEQKLQPKGKIWWLAFLLDLRPQDEFASLEKDFCLNILESDLAQSINHRMDLMVNWDEILKVHHSLLVAVAKIVGQSLYTIAEQLQDSRAMEDVKLLLHSLDLKIDKKRINIFRTPFSELRNSFETGLFLLERTYDKVIQLQVKRRELQEAKNRFDSAKKKMEDNSKNSQESRSSDLMNKTQAARRMIYQEKKKF
ncbi:MAG: hypothetical protein AB1656_01620 [Candidatus Omnitrophota bacterium]